MSEKRYHVEATAICHIDYGTVKAKDPDLISQIIMKAAPHLKISGDNVCKASITVTEVKSEEVL